MAPSGASRSKQPPSSTDQRVENGGAVRAADFVGFHNEAEVAFTIAKDVPRHIDSIESLMPYLETVHVGLDVPDNLYDATKGTVRAGDVIAMNCAAHTFVIGEGVDPQGVDYKAMRVWLEHDGRTVYSGSASNVMGDPREAVLALVRHLRSRGGKLRAGQVVLSGSVAGAYAPRAEMEQKGTYVGKADGLPPVRLIVD